MLYILEDLFDVETQAVVDETVYEEGEIYGLITYYHPSSL